MFIPLPILIILGFIIGQGIGSILDILGFMIGWGIASTLDIFIFRD